MANRLHAGQPRDSQRQRLYNAEDVLRGRRVSPAAKRHLTDSVRHTSKMWARDDDGNLMKDDQGKSLLVPMYYPAVESVQDYVDAVLASAWFRRRWGFRQIRVTANPGANSRGGYGDVHMGAEHRRSESVILHEIAHNLTNFHSHAYHGVEFAAVLLTLVKFQMGRQAYDDLRASYAEHRVKYRAGMKAVPKPSESRRGQADYTASRQGVKPRTTTRVKAARRATPKPERRLTYADCYNYGWTSRTLTGFPSERLVMRDGFDQNAWDDGYLDQAAGRDKWHLRDCKAHHNGEGGCGVA